MKGIINMARPGGKQEGFPRQATASLELNLTRKRVEKVLWIMQMGLNMKESIRMINKQGSGTYTNAKGHQYIGEWANGKPY